MTMEDRRQLDGVADLETVAARIEQHASIADLAAGLGIKRRAIEQDDRLVAGSDCIDRLAVPDQRDNLATIFFQRFVAEKFRGMQGSNQFRRQADATAKLAGTTRALALLFHQ